MNSPLQGFCLRPWQDFVAANLFLSWQILIRFRYPRSTLNTADFAQILRYTRLCPTPPLPSSAACPGSRILAGIGPAAPHCPRRPPSSLGQPVLRRLRLGLGERLRRRQRGRGRDGRSHATARDLKKFIEHPERVGRFREILRSRVHRQISNQISRNVRLGLPPTSWAAAAPQRVNC